MAVSPSFGSMLIPSSALFDIRPFSARAAMTNLKRKRHNRSREEDASASAASVGPPCCLLVLLKAALSDEPQQRTRTHFRNSMGEQRERAVRWERRSFRDTRLDRHVRVFGGRIVRATIFASCSNVQSRCKLASSLINGVLLAPWT